MRQQTSKTLSSFLSSHLTWFQSPPEACSSPNKCSLAHTEGDFNVVRYLTTCATCPDNYPWLGNSRGRDTDQRDTYQKFEE